MRIKRSELIDVAIWVLIAFYTLIAHWIWYGRGIQENILLLLFIVQVVRRVKKTVRHNEKLGWILMVTVVVYTVVVTIKGETLTYLLKDIKSILMALFSLLYIFSFYKANPVRCKKYIETTCKILSVYMWINSVIILIQYKVPYFLMNRSTIALVGNSAYFDQLTGFIGINGTTRWNILTCIIILYYITEAKNRRDWIKAAIFVVLSVLISMINSARSFLVMMPLFVIFYYVLVKKKSVKLVLKYCGAVVLSLATIAITYNLNGFVKNFIDDLFFDKVAIYSSRNLAYMVSANDDRAVAINYAIQQGGLFGKGIGSIPMHFANSYVKYLGINSTSSFIYMLGIIGYFAYSCCLGIVGNMFFKKKSILLVVGFTVLWLIISYLLPVYSSIILMLGTGIIIVMFTTEENASVQKKGG